MVDDFHEFEFGRDTTAERDAQDLLKLGIQPELLCSLSPDSARIVLSGVAKVLSILTHPDKDGETEAFGLDIRDINRIASLTHTDDDHWATILSSINQEHGVPYLYKQYESLKRDLDDSLSRSYDLALSIINTPEQLREGEDFRLLVHPPTSSKKPNTDREIIDINIKDGRVVDATYSESTPHLLSSLSQESQAFLEKLRPSPETPEEYVFISPKESLPDLPSGWIKLLSAKSKANPKNERLAVVMYDKPEDHESYPELLGASIVGLSTADMYKHTEDMYKHTGNDNPKVITKFLAIDFTQIDQLTPFVKFSTEEIAQLLSGGHFRPFNPTAKVMPRSLLALHKTAKRGKRSFSTIISPMSVKSLN